MIPVVIQCHFKSAAHNPAENSSHRYASESAVNWHSILRAIKLEIQSIIVMIHRPAPLPVQKSATTDLPSPCHPSKSSRHLISPVYHPFVWASVHSFKTRPEQGPPRRGPEQGSGAMDICDELDDSAHVSNSNNKSKSREIVMCDVRIKNDFVQPGIGQLPKCFASKSAAPLGIPFCAVLVVCILCTQTVIATQYHGSAAATNAEVHSSIFDQCILGHQRKVTWEAMDETVDPKFKCQMRRVFYAPQRKDVKKDDESHLAYSVFPHIWTFLSPKVLPKRP